MTTPKTQRTAQMKTFTTSLLALAAAVGAAAAFSAHAACIPTDGLVSWWRGEDSAQDSIGAHDGALLGGVTFASGAVGQAFQFDASESSFISLPNSPDFQPPSNEVTIAACIRPDFTKANGFDTILTKRDGCDGNGISYNLNVAKRGSGYPPGQVAFTISPASSITNSATSATPLPDDGNFHHVSGTYDGTTLRVYLDGIEAGAVSHSGPIPITTSAPVISHHGGTCGPRAVAAIDEIEFYNRKLSHEEIASIYLAQGGRPRIAISTSAGEAHLSWLSCAGGYVLQSAVSLPAGEWLPVTNAVQIVGSSNVVAVPTVSEQRYYRIAK